MVEMCPHAEAVLSQEGYGWCSAIRQFFQTPFPHGGLRQMAQAIVRAPVALYRQPHRRGRISHATHHHTGLHALSAHCRLSESGLFLRAREPRVVCSPRGFLYRYGLWCSSAHPAADRWGDCFDEGRADSCATGLVGETAAGKRSRPGRMGVYDGRGTAYDRARHDYCPHDALVYLDPSIPSAWEFSLAWQPGPVRWERPLCQ